ncbi:MAG TPA: response regulator [Caulobacteraceae bacterium]|jgi:CheY-like chemotaxis protein
MVQVLVAEDEPFTALAVVDHLEDLGHTVRDAPDGAKALTVLETFEPDIVVTDLMMPNVDGYELIRRLRRRPGPAIPIILITAVPETRLPADLAYDGYLGKPVNCDALARMINRLAKAA